MANNINIDIGRAVNAAISHVPNNEFRFTNVGMWGALRDPSLKRLIDATNPMLVSREDGGSRVVGYKENTLNPRIILNWKPASSQGYATSRIPAGSTAGTNGAAAIQAASTLEVVFSNTLQFEVITNLFTGDTFKEPSAVEYLNKLTNDKVRLQAYRDPAYSKVRGKLGTAGYEILSRMDEDLVTPVDSDLITKMVAGIGKNPAFPDISQIGDGTADAPIPEVYALEANGTPSLDFWNAIMDTARASRFVGKPILVGGTKMAHYMQLKGIVGANDQGFLLDKMLDLGVIWYFDALIDTVFGQDKVIMFDSGAACMQTWLDHGDMGLTPIGYHENMYFGNTSFDLMQWNGTSLAASSAPDSYTIDLDFRVKEGLSNIDLPSDRIVPSIRWGVFKRPVGFFTSNTSNIMNKVTGIYGFELMTKS